MSSIHIQCQNMKKYVQNFWASRKGVPPPPNTKKNFFADFHDLGHERKKNKKSVKMTQFCPDPPP